MTTMTQSKQQQESGQDGIVIDDCCSFLHLGALALSDMMFDDSSVELDIKDGGNNFVPSLLHRHIDQDPYTITIGKRHHDEEETIEDDGYTAVTQSTYFTDGDTWTMMEVDDENVTIKDHKRRGASSSSDCDNTLNDISAIVFSKMSCSPRGDKSSRKKMEVHVVSDDGKEEDDGSESNILSMDTVPSLFDDDEEEGIDDRDEEEPHLTKEDMSIGSPLRNRPDVGVEINPANIPVEITPQRKTKKKLRAPYQLKRFVSRGVQRFRANSFNESQMELPSSSKPRTILGATSQRQHPSKKVANHPTNAMNESVPFDEPLWYH